MQTPEAPLSAELAPHVPRKGSCKHTPGPSLQASFQTLPRQTVTRDPGDAAERPAEAAFPWFQLRERPFPLSTFTTPQAFLQLNLLFVPFLSFLKSKAQH